jgi:hypothetical protein
MLRARIEERARLRPIGRRHQHGLEALEEALVAPEQSIRVDLRELSDHPHATLFERGLDGGGEIHVTFARLIEEVREIGEHEDRVELARRVEHPPEPLLPLPEPAHAGHELRAARRIGAPSFARSAQPREQRRALADPLVADEEHAAALLTAEPAVQRAHELVATDDRRSVELRVQRRRHRPEHVERFFAAPRVEQILLPLRAARCFALAIDEHAHRHHPRLGGRQDPEPRTGIGRVRAQVALDLVHRGRLELFAARDVDHVAQRGHQHPRRAVVRDHHRVYGHLRRPAQLRGELRLRQRDLEAPRLRRVGERVARDAHRRGGGELIGEVETKLREHVAFASDRDVLGLDERIARARSVGQLVEDDQGVERERHGARG